MDEGGDEAEDDEDYIGDLGESANTNIQPLISPYSLVNTLFDKLFFEQFPYHRDLACEDVDG